MKIELLTIGPFTVYGYGLMIAIGILAGCLTAEYRAGKQKLDSEQIFPMILWCLVGGFFCAKLLFWITEWKSIVQDPGFIMETLSSGFVVFGGIIGGILTGLLYCRIRKLVFFKYADVILPSVALAQGFGRIGCFLAGCCYGKVFPWGYYPWKCGNFVDFPVYQYFYRDCGDRAADTDQEKKR